MHDFNYYFNEVMDFFNSGFHEGFSHVNAVLGLIIALLATFGMSRWGKLWAMALIATIVHLVAEVMIPVVANHAQFALPADLLQGSYWRTAAAIYLGYVIVIAVFFFIKRTVLGGGGLKAAH